MFYWVHAVFFLGIPNMIHRKAASLSFKPKKVRNNHESGPDPEQGSKAFPAFYSNY